MESETAKDVFSDVYSDEWQADFRKKEQILDNHFKQITPIEYYRQVFGDVEAPCKMFVQELGSYRNASNYKKVREVLSKFNGVCVYLQSFYRNMTATHRNIDRCYGFVVDLDNIRSVSLPEVIKKINKIDYKPNILVSSGNGIHLYYLFTEPFDFYSYTFVISTLDYRKRKEAFKPVMQVYNKLCDMYEGEGIVYKVDRGHLSRPIRMCGSTTKNVFFRTIGYKVSDERKSFEDYAELFGIELAADELLSTIDKLFQEDTSYDMPEDAVSSPEPVAVKPAEKSVAHGIFEDINTTFLTYYKCNKEEVRKRWLEYAKNLGDNERPVTAAKQARTAIKQNHNGYIATLLKIRDGASIGNRQKLLLIFCTRAAMYKIPEERMKADAREIQNYWNEKWPNDIVRDRELESAFRYYNRYRFRNETVKQQTGVDLSIENKREAERAKKRATKKQMRSEIRQAATEFINANRDCSYNEIAKFLSSNGYDVSVATIKRDEVIRAVKESGE